MGVLEVLLLAISLTVKSHEVSGHPAVLGAKAKLTTQNGTADLLGADDPYHITCNGGYYREEIGQACKICPAGFYSKPGKMTGEAQDLRSACDVCDEPAAAEAGADNCDARDPVLRYGMTVWLHNQYLETEQTTNRGKSWLDVEGNVADSCQTKDRVGGNSAQWTIHGGVEGEPADEGEPVPVGAEGEPVLTGVYVYLKNVNNNRYLDTVGTNVKTNPSKDRNPGKGTGAWRLYITDKITGDDKFTPAPAGDKINDGDIVSLENKYYIDTDPNGDPWLDIFGEGLFPTSYKCIVSPKHDRDGTGTGLWEIKIKY